MRGLWPPELLTATEEVELRALASQLASLDDAGRTAQHRGWLAYPIPRVGLVHPNATTGHKCAWRYGSAQCAVLYLPRGGPMPARLTTAAMEWAAKAMSRAVGLTVRQQAFNPSAVDRSNVLLRVEPLCKWYDFNARSCGTFADLPRNTSAPRERLVRTVWLRDGVVERGVAGSDPRGVWLNRHTLLAIYSNWATFWRDDPRTKLPEHAFVVMVAQNLSDPRSAPVPLWLAGLRQAAWEKNWVPFRHSGRVLLSYKLTPQHMVLICEWSCGRCTLAYNTSSQHVFDAFKQDAVLGSRAKPRLTSPAILVRGVYVGIGHFRLADSTYLHFFFSFASEPPFEMLQVSKTFRLHSRVQDGLREGVQYVSGLYLQTGDTEQLVMTYGLGDHEAMETSLPVEEAFRMLADRGDGSENYRFCATAHNSRPSRYSCDDSACEGVNVPVLALCHGRCGRWPWNCDPVEEWSDTLSGRLSRALNSSCCRHNLSAAQHAFARARQRHSSLHDWTASRAAWAGLMLDDAKQILSTYATVVALPKY